MKLFIFFIIFPTSFTWFIPLTCSFGRSPNDSSPYEKDFYIDQKECIFNKKNKKN